MGVYNWMMGQVPFSFVELRFCAFRYFHDILFCQILLASLRVSNFQVRIFTDAFQETSAAQGLNNCYSATSVPFMPKAFRQHIAHRRDMSIAADSLPLQHWLLIKDQPTCSARKTIGTTTVTLVRPDQSFHLLPERMKLSGIDVAGKDHRLSNPKVF